MSKRLLSWSLAILATAGLATLVASTTVSPTSQPTLTPSATAAVSDTANASNTATNNATNVDQTAATLPEERLDGQEAMEYVRYQVGLGARTPGSAESRQLAQYLKTHLETWGYKTEYQDFTAQTPKGEVAMRNVVATLPGSREERFIVGAHYDTKIFSEFKFVGANDGASGTAVALELAHALSKAPLRHTMQFVFFDGEEAVEHWSDQDSLYGSRHFVQSLMNSGEGELVRGVIILDMVGDKNMLITQEWLSDYELRQTMNDAVKQLGVSSFFPIKRAQALDDDHRPFLDAGLPALDIIGLYMYGDRRTEPDYWHKAGDTLDKVSAKSLGISGSVTLRTLRLLDME